MTPGSKIGGLPAWAWGLVVLGGLGVGLWLRHRSSSPTSVGVPVSTGGFLGATGGGASDGTPAGSITGGMDPLFAGMLADSNNALVNESAILAGLTGQAVDGALGVASTTLGQATALFSTFTTLTAPVFTQPASPAGGSPSGQTVPQSPPAVLVSPEQAAPPTRTWQATDTPGVFRAPNVGTSGVVTARPSAPATPALVDVSGHVVNAKGFRVGGATMDA